MMGMGAIDDKMSDVNSIIEGPGSGIRGQMAKGPMKTPANVPQAAGMPITTPQGVVVPKLNMEDNRQSKHETSAKKGSHRRQLSDSSRGSIGRKERLRNALTGRSDGSADGADQPKELPKEELIDFLLQYDRTDPFSYKLIELDDKNSQGSGGNPMSGGSVNSGTQLSDGGKTDELSKSEIMEGGSQD